MPVTNYKIKRFFQLELLDKVDMRPVLRTNELLMASDWTLASINH